MQAFDPARSRPQAGKTGSGKKTMPLDTLEKLSAAKNYNRWVFELCCPYLGQRLLEIGSGIGNLTGYFLERGPVLATDLEPKHLAQAQACWPGNARLTTAVWDVTQEPPTTVTRFQADTILCINLLEHVRNDAGVLRRLHDLLPPGGRLVVYAPALPSLYGTLDAELQHVRRYRRQDLRRLAQQAGFFVEALRYVNFPGILGWWWNGRVLQRKYFSPNQVRSFDRLVPWLAAWEKILPPVAGQSLLLAGRKPLEDKS